MRRFNSEKLIEEVEKRPGLYDKTAYSMGCNDKRLRQELWTAIYPLVVHDWNKLDDKQRTVKGKDVQRKWKNIRDSFRKEMLLQQQYQQDEVDGITPKKRTPYMFYDQLTFLEAFSQRRRITFKSRIRQSREIEENNEVEESCSSDDKEDEDLTIKEEQMDFDLTDSCDPIATDVEQVQKGTLFNIANQKQVEDIDEDIYFLMSLVPSFKKLSDEQKIDAKMQFLQVLQKIKFPKK